MQRINVIIPVSAMMMAGTLIAVWMSLSPPDMALIGRQVPEVKIHLGAAVLAFILGLILLLGPKGVLPHRVFGWVWVGLMLITAVSSFFIREINDGQFGFIHALSGWTTIAAPMVIYFARRKQVRRHRLMVYGLYFGGLVIAGLFTFIPDRLLWQVFFG